MPLLVLDLGERLGVDLRNHLQHLELQRVEAPELLVREDDVLHLGAQLSRDPTNFRGLVLGGGGGGCIEAKFCK